MLSIFGKGVQFQPALPMRGVTKLHQVPGQTKRISTRTPHAGSDVPKSQ